MDFCELNECEINFAVSALANSLAQGLDREEIFFLARVFSQLSGALQLIASHRALCDTKKEDKGPEKPGVK
ncbi:MAG TPA: hypothetical protein VIL24_02320 [Clostridia bacterium]